MKKIIPFICLAITLGGCSMTTNGNESEVVENNDIIIGKGGIKLDANDFVRVQDYNGDGYTLKNGEKTKEIITGKHDLIEEAVIAYFKENHKTDVLVHNIVPAIDAATVYVESIGTPHFYTYAIVPVEHVTKSIITDNIFIQKGRIESNITSALFAKAYEENFNNLNEYLLKIAQENSLSGLTDEAIERVGGNGYSTPYYFVNAMFTENKEIYQAYLENPNITKEEIAEKFSYLFTPENISFGITFYMSEDGQDPNEELYNKIVAGIEELNNIPPGSYSVILHDNLINAKVASASKGNSKNKTALNKIIKK